MLLTLLALATALRPPAPRPSAPRGRVAMSDAPPGVDLAARNFIHLSPSEALNLASAWLPGDEQAEGFASLSGALAEADASEDPAGKRRLIDALHVAGVARGPGTALFASVRKERVVGDGAALCAVEATRAYWSVLCVCVEPEARVEPGLAIEAEAATLSELYAMASASGACLRVHKDAQARLQGSRRCLGLTAPPVGAEGAGGSTWLHCRPESAAEAECEVVEAGEEAEECLIVSPISSDCVWTAADEEARTERKFDLASNEGFRDPKKGNSA